MTWPCIRIIGRRLTQIIESCPNELADSPVIIIRQSKIFIWNIRPGTMLQVISGRLVIIVLRIPAFLYREFIYATRTNGRRCFRTKYYILRQQFISFQITVCTIIKTGHINHGGKTISKNASHLIHAASNRTCRIFTMTDILQERSDFIAYRTTLGRNFITDTPHYDTRIVAELMQHIYHITFCPLVEITVIAILTFGNVPFVERFQHHHKTHFITKLH